MPKKKKITDKTKLNDLTVGEFKTLMRGLLQEAVWELEQSMPDPDEGLKLKPEIMRELWLSKHDQSEGIPAKDVMRELGLLDE